ncbi:MAG: hypothetical protein J5979_03950 [Lachnospiraceae bacterium]|nr:hypothetical protein [Lachnospiraceae bacterium]
MISEINKNNAKKLLKCDLNDYKILSALLDTAIAIKDDDENEKDYFLELGLKVKKYASRNSRKAIEFYNLYRKNEFFLAPYLFRDFLIAMEWDRAPQKRFYLPRRKTLDIVVDDLQDLEDGKLDFYGLSMPPRVGKSTICIFFLAWVMGRRPNGHSAMSGHSGDLADGFYTEALNIMELDVPEDKTIYHFRDIFPDTFLQKKSAEKREITLNDPDRFATLTCRGIDGTWTGAVDISSDGYLYVDDMVRDRKESLSPSRLEGRYQDYLNVLVDRKNDGTRELMVGTRWNVMDPLGRVEKENKDNPRYRFRKIPALNEHNESNFVYDYGLGFSTEHYLKMKERLDKNEWEAKFQQRPFVREGLLFPEDELLTYNGVLPPESGLIRKLTACDVAWGGGDSLSMPWGYEYDDGYIYVTDWIFNKGDKTVTQPIVVGKALYHKPQMMHFEANNGGDEYADKIDELLQAQNYSCSISSSKAPNTMSKLAKIIQYAPDVKRRCKFLAANKRDEEYHDAMDELTMFVQIGKNDFDDAADGVTQLMMLANGGTVAKADYIDSPY